MMHLRYVVTSTVSLIGYLLGKGGAQKAEMKMKYTASVRLQIPYAMLTATLSPFLLNKNILM